MKSGCDCNRIRTIIYGVSEGRGTLGRPILKSEITKHTPYNTYQVVGLPPTAIANPGRASIEAVLRPAKTDALYFVADGTGGHVFASTLTEHNRNVAKWRVIEAAIRAREAEEARLAALQGDQAAETSITPAAPRLSFPGANTGAFPGLMPGSDLSAIEFPRLPSDMLQQAQEPIQAEGTIGGPVPLPDRNPRLR